METLGIIRHIDPIGRIVIPKPIRKKLNITCNDPLSFTVDGDNIVLSKYKENCVICGSSDQVTIYKTKIICVDCLSGINIEK